VSPTKAMYPGLMKIIRDKINAAIEAKKRSIERAFENMFTRMGLWGFG
jgi:hypothetical protein